MVSTYKKQKQKTGCSSSSAEKRPFSSVDEAQQHLLRWCELHSQPYEGRIHLHHFKQHKYSAQTIWKQGPRPQKDLQQCEQDWQDVQDCVPCSFWDLQSGLLGYVPQQGAGN